LRTGNLPPILYGYLILKGSASIIFILKGSASIIFILKGSASIIFILIIFDFPQPFCGAALPLIDFDVFSRYKLSMKTAISLPDNLFAAADLYAQQQNLTRSELYAKALAEYLQHHRDENVTERINAALVKITQDQLMGEGSLDALRRLPW
jgi:hypothetical protein